MNFSDFVTKIMERARARHVYQKANPRVQLAKMDTPVEAILEYNSNMCMILRPAAPEEVKQRVLEDVDECLQLTAVSILDEVWNCVAPGGQEELDGAHEVHQEPRVSQ